MKKANFSGVVQEGPSLTPDAAAARLISSYEVEESDGWGGSSCEAEAFAVLFLFGFLKINLPMIFSLKMTTG
ncbi:hypothetical protein [Methylosarcina fibrata]|uniref:hypothetical protein n=1 Tax=Methylosarcina fibrata TaxID=105972 RepID=UPI0018DEDA31|nr:hypothetical protein [Methylosarcina fibrata]